MVRFTSEEKIEQKLPMTYHAMFYAKFGEDEFINITIPIDSPEIEDSEKLREFLEKEGIKILTTLLSPEYIKKEWDLEEFD